MPHKESEQEMSQFQYQCEECGATEASRPTDCCDQCIVKFFLQNPQAPSIDQYSHWVENDNECAGCGMDEQVCQDLEECNYGVARKQGR